jgi:transposase
MLESPHTATMDAPAPSQSVSQTASDASQLTLQQLREMLERLQGELKFHKTRNEALNFEIARLKRWRFGSSSESLDSSTQVVLFDHILVDTALEDRAAEDAKKPAAVPPRAKGQAVRQALPAKLPRIEHRHELQETHCACGQALKRIGEEVSEQLDCVPAQFFVLRHIRGKYACACCQTIAAAPMPAQMIDKGIPAPGLLAQVAVAKHDDHLPLYRQEEIYARSGVHIARSSMAQWIGICGVRLKPLADALQAFILSHAVVHADETPVSLLAPGRGKTKKAYVWVYRTTNFVAQRAVLFDFCASRGGEHPQRVLQEFSGTLVTDDFSGYHKLQSQGSITGALCMAHARRKLFEAHKLNGSQIAGEAVTLIAKLYEIEQEARELDPQARQLLRQSRAKPIADALHTWLIAQRQALVKADITAKAIDYSLSNWRALTHYLDDGNVPIDNNAVENSIRPIAVGRNNANSSLMRTRLRCRAIPPSVEAPTASLLLRMITATAGTASTPWAGGSELA